MSLKAKVEAIIYAAEEPITFTQIFALVKDEAQQELLARQAQAYVSPETAAAIIPAEDDRESNLAAEPMAAPPPDLAMEAPAPAETVLPEPEPELPLPVAPISAAEPQPITEAEM